ncbi:hypothetical protein ES703_11328 [subsurface metagenome]
MDNEQESGINQIVSLILTESREVKNPDPVSRIHNVHMKVTTKLLQVMEAIRKKEVK